MCVRLTSLHEDVDVAICFCKVDKLDNIGVIDFKTYLDLSLNPFDDVTFKLISVFLASFLLLYLTFIVCTCLSKSIFDMILHAKTCLGWPLTQA